jgi:nucleotide-binding universal stress UspA family protein
MTTRRPSIIVGCDGSIDSERALSWAASYARAAEGSLTLVAAWDWPTYQGVPVVYGDYDPRAACRQMLQHLRQRADVPPDRTDVRAVKGHPTGVLLNRAADADLLVVGPHGFGAFSRLVLGSVSAGVVAHAHCPVAVVRDDPQRPRSRGVVVGVDDSDAARIALRWAMDYADLVGESLTVVRCADMVPPSIPVGYPVDMDYDPMAMRHSIELWLHDLLAKEEADRGRPVAAGAGTIVVEGNPARLLVELSNDAHVTVVGRRGSGGFRRLVLGSVSSALAHHSLSTVVVTPEA